MLKTGLILFTVAFLITVIVMVVSIFLHMFGKGELDKLFTGAASAVMVIIILLAFFQGLKIINGFMIDGYDFGQLSDAIRLFEVLGNE